MKYAIAAIVLLGSILATASLAHAVSRASTTPGAGFTCDVNTRECTCDGTWEGADCQGMKKNCQGSIYKICMESPTKYCVCTMALRRRPPSDHPPLTTPLAH